MKDEYYYSDVLRHLQWMVMDIQEAGMLVDMDKASYYISIARTKQKEFRDILEESLGYPFNPNSSKQVIETCRYDLGLPITDSGDELSLLKCMIDKPDAKAFVSTIVDYRKVAKQAGTYLNPKPWPDGRVRSQFRTYGTLTYRLSSKNPNLQNLPRSPKYGINIKDIYIAPPGYYLVELDYSALEDRIPAIASNCAKLINMFDSGADVHLYRAGIIFNKVMVSKKENAEERDFAKTLRYARGYGSSLRTIAEQLLEAMHEWHPVSELRPMIARLDDDMPEILAWHNECWDFAERTATLYDGFGLKRTLFMPPGDRRQVAYSWPVAATASGIMNRSMVRIYKAKESGWLHPTTRCICQVHDSLIFEIMEDRLLEESKKVKDLMEVPVKIFNKDPHVFPVEAKYGRRLGSTEPLALL